MNHNLGKSLNKTDKKNKKKVEESDEESVNNIKKTPKKKNTPKKQPTKGKENSSAKKKKTAEKNIKAKNSKPSKDKTDDDEDEQNADEFEELLLPGQKYPSPPQGDSLRAYYESFLEQKPDSFLALKWCVEYGCLESERAQASLAILAKKKKK